MPVPCGMCEVSSKPTRITFQIDRKVTEILFQFAAICQGVLTLDCSTFDGKGFTEGGDGV